MSVVVGKGGAIRSLNHWRDVIVRETKVRPARTVALSLGAGYLLGGGLFSALTARLVGTGLRLGFRLALIPFVTQSLVSMGENLVRGTPGGHSDDTPVAQDTDRDSKNNSDQKETRS